MYGKIKEDGTLAVLRDKYVKHDGKIILRPSDRLLRELGYKPIVGTDIPAVPDGGALVVDYEDAGDVIRTVYSIIVREK